MTKLGFVMSGPQGGQIVEMEDADLKTAIEDGWALDFEEANMGGKPDPFAGWNTTRHEKAEAYLTSKGLYGTREMRAESPGGDAGKSKPSPDGDDAEDQKSKPAVKPSKK